MIINTSSIKQMFSYFLLDKQMEGVLFKNGQKSEGEDEEGRENLAKQKHFSSHWLLTLAAGISGGYFPGVSVLSKGYK